MRVFVVAASIALLSGCKEEIRPPEAAGTPNAVGYALLYPHELERTASDYDKGRTEALQRCGESVELIDAVKDPVDTELWEAVLVAAEKNGASRFYASRQRENEAFGRVFHGGDDEISKRTAGTAQYTAEQNGCQAAPVVGGATGGALRRLVDKHTEDNLRDSSEAAELMRGHQEALGKGNIAPIAKQADLVAYASYLISLKIPTLAYERDRLLSEHRKVSATLERAIDAERERQGKSGASDADKKAVDEQLRKLEASKSLVEELAKKLRGADAKVEAELHDTRESCRDILDAVRKSVKKRTSK